MKILHAVVLTLVFLLAPSASMAGETADPRKKAAEETREALEAYRDALESELRRLETWLKESGVRERLRDERAMASKKLEQLTEEAQRMWDSVRARMDAVVEDLKRRYDKPRAQQ